MAKRKQIAIRATEEEKNKLVEAAKKSRQSLSSYILTLADKKEIKNEKSA